MMSLVLTIFDLNDIYTICILIPATFLIWKKNVVDDM